MACEGTPKCCKAICAVSWLVLLVVVTLGSLIFFRECTFYTSVGLTYRETFAFYFAIGYFFFVAFSAYVFIVLAKTDSACNCCEIARFIWALLHIAGGITAFVLLYKFKGPEGKHENVTVAHKQNFIVRRYRTTDPRKFPDWFIEFHTTQKCCGLFSTYTDPNLLSSRCHPVFAQDPTLSRGCGFVLYDLYINCTTRIFWYAVVTLILGLLPFVIYALNYRKLVKTREKAFSPSSGPIGPENKEEPVYDRQPGPESSAKSPGSPKNSPGSNNNNKPEETKIDMDSRTKLEQRNANENNHAQDQQELNNSAIPARNKPPKNNTNVQTQQNDLRSTESASAKNFKNQHNNTVSNQNSST